MTRGHTVIMGRKTYESIVDRLGKSLPERRSIVISRDPTLKVLEGAIVATSVEEVLKIISPEEENFIFGGAEIYKLFLPLARKIYMTVIHTKIDGDAFFSELDNSWDLKLKEDHKKDEKNEYDYSFLTYERKK